MDEEAKKRFEELDKRVAALEETGQGKKDPESKPDGEKPEGEESAEGKPSA